MIDWLNSLPRHVAIWVVLTALVVFWMIVGLAVPIVAELITKG